MCEIFQLHVKDFRIQAIALGALNEATETYLIRIVKDSNLSIIHTKQIILIPRICG